ncbi:hypothetical protein BaRGS_00006415 [Batillaria attramentaria]|uniref:Uncharacterized protein n=1 Tax=Batillaria attramentaria TaxID=370345 RepID=A0ABD0LSW3_9CAEN
MRGHRGTPVQASTRSLQGYYSARAILTVEDIVLSTNYHFARWEHEEADSTAQLTRDRERADRHTRQGYVTDDSRTPSVVCDLRFYKGSGFCALRIWEFSFNN